MAKTIKQKFIIDESGSMEDQTHTVITGFNEQLQDMAREEKEKDVQYLVSLTKFSHEVTKVYVDVPLAEVAPLTKKTYRPSGSTALFDAIGQTIDTATRGESDVMVTIMTDGHENASTKWKRAAIKTLIDIRQKENKWGFVYLGANQDAFTAAQSIGVENALNYSVANTDKAMNAMSDVRSVYTTGVVRGVYNTSNLTCNVNQSDLVE